jgi:hypothetical protein
MADGAIRGDVGAQRPLCFLHIAKTGGTSLSNALGRVYPDHRRFSDGGHITVDYLDRVEGALLGPCFIAGHPGPGVVRRLAGKADIITLLRRPDRQAVSHYLHILADPEHPLHHSASRQSFSAFFRENPYLIIFQAASFGAALSTPDAPVDPLNRNGVDTLLHFLESLTFVGAIDRAEECCTQLSARLSIDPPLRLAYRNSALCRGVSPREVKRLLQEYRALVSDPELSCLFDIESRFYAKAEALLMRSMGHFAPAARPSDRPSPVEIFGADSFDSAAGCLATGRYVCPLADEPDRRLPHHLIYGPYHRLERGGHAVDFHLSLEASAGHGRIEIEVLANGACLSRRWLRPTTAPRLTLCFFNQNEANVLEFRVRAKGFDDGRLEFHGVTVRRAAPYRTWPSLIGAAVRRAVRPIVRALAAAIPNRVLSNSR